MRQPAEQHWSKTKHTSLQKELPGIQWCQNDRIFDGVSDFEFFCCKHAQKLQKNATEWAKMRIFGDISETKRALRDSLVPKQPDFRWRIRFHFFFSKRHNIFRKMHKKSVFFKHFSNILGTKRAVRDSPAL